MEDEFWLNEKLLLDASAEVAHLKELAQHYLVDIREAARRLRTCG